MTADQGTSGWASAAEREQIGQEAAAYQQLAEAARARDAEPPVRWRMLVPDADLDTVVGLLVAAGHTGREASQAPGGVHIGLSRRRWLEELRQPLAEAGHRAGEPHWVGTLHDHEGCAYRVMPDGTETDMWCGEYGLTGHVGYRARCECGWAGSVFPVPDPDPYDSPEAIAQWEREHIEPMYRHAAAARAAAAAATEDEPVPPTSARDPRGAAGAVAP